MAVGPMTKISPYDSHIYNIAQRSSPRSLSDVAHEDDVAFPLKINKYVLRVASAYRHRKSLTNAHSDHHRLHRETKTCVQQDRIYLNTTARSTLPCKRIPRHRCRPTEISIRLWANSSHRFVFDYSFHDESQFEERTPSKKRWLLFKHYSKLRRFSRCVPSYKSDRSISNIMAHYFAFTINEISLLEVKGWNKNKRYQY